LVGPADLAVELISDDSVTRDRRDKFAEYAAAGIPEYWLLDPRPDHHRADFYALGPDRTYEAIPLDAEGRFASRVLPGFWLDPAWLWQDPLPKPAEILRRIVPDAT
jgi:Uma2 family endonuclease